MFESSLVESSGQLRSKSSRYMAVTATFNVAVVAVMMLVPLLYPEALPRTSLTAMLTAPPPPPAAAPSPATPVRTVKATAPLNAFTAPTTVPHHIDMSHDDPPPAFAVAGTTSMSMAGSSGSDGPAGALGIGPPPTVLVKPIPITRPTAPAHISSGVIAGNKLSGATPVYPAIARAAHVSGAVVLHAVISKTGDIQSLSVVSGHEMLRASAVAAVQGWKYRPYLLSGEPTEVDTTITVNFTFGG